MTKHWPAPILYTWKRRAGQGGDDIFPLPPVDTVNATPADPRPWYSVPCLPIGHGYVTRNSSVIADVQVLLASDTPPASRVRLLPRRTRQTNLEYWMFQAAN